MILIGIGSTDLTINQLIYIVNLFITLNKLFRLKLETKDPYLEKNKKHSPLFPWEN